MPMSKRVTKRPNYGDAVRWIAFNDDPGSDFAKDLTTVSGLLSVGLAADLFGARAEQVAIDVINVRANDPQSRFRDPETWQQVYGR